MIKINPLNVLECREVSDPPIYFKYHTATINHNRVKSLKEWIYNNLKHRFYAGETLVLKDNQWDIQVKIGFEDPKELSFFLLACPHLK
jgi:hypothetical protein